MNRHKKSLTISREKNRMKRLLVLSLILLLVLPAACTPAATSGETAVSALKVSGDGASKSYTRADLEALGSSQSTFKDVAYRGVAVDALLKDAGFDTAQVRVVKAVASDGFTVNYDLSQVFVDGVIVAYARADGELAEEDGAFRMVLPGAEGKLNLRMLTELQVVK